MGMEDILVMCPTPFEQTFVPPSHGDSTKNLASNGQAVSKNFFPKMLNLSDLGPRSMNDIPIGSCTHLVNCI